MKVAFVFSSLSSIRQESTDQLIDLDRFDPLASASPGLDYSALSPEELDKLIDHDYSKMISPECEAAIMGMFGWTSAGLIA